MTLRSLGGGTIAKPQPVRAPPTHAWLYGAALVLVTAIVYSPSLHGEFIFDDDLLLTASPLIQASDGAYRFWFTTQAPDYWPVFNTALWVQWRMWGLNPTGYHAVNVLLHACTGLLLWRLLERLAIPGAFLAALLFVVHPVNVESVAWISQLKDLLALLFSLVSIACYLRADGTLLTEENRPISYGWYALSVAAYAVAMLSKGSAVSVPAIVAGIIWLRRYPTVRDLARLAPFILITLVLIPINVLFAARNITTDMARVSALQRFLGAGAAVWFYLSKAVLPIGLSFVYPHWNVAPDRVAWWLPLAGVLAVTAVLWSQRRTWQPCWVGWVCFGLCLAPVLGFSDTGFMRYALVADHYQHMALIAVLALAGFYWSGWQQITTQRWIATGVAVAVVLCCAVLALQRNRLFVDRVTLYRATLQANPDAWFLHNNLGILLTMKNRNAEAIEHFEAAVRLQPSYVEAHNNLSNALRSDGRIDEAIEHSRRALQLQPDLPDAHYSLGLSFAQRGQLSDAIAEYRTAVQLKPDFELAHYNLGLALLQNNQASAAIDALRRALQIDPTQAQVHNDLGVALVATGQLDEAIGHFERALELQPGLHDAEVNLEVVRGRPSTNGPTP